MDSKHSICGFNIRQIIDALPQAQDEVNKFDCSLVVTMLSGEYQKSLRFTKDSAAGADLREVCGLFLDTHDMF